MGIESWSTTAASNNAAPPNGWPEGQAASTVNDCARQMMASIRTWLEDAQWIPFGHTPTRIDNDTFTVATDLTAIYHVGRRLKVTGSATGYATITASSYSAPNTTVDVTMDSGNLPVTLSAVYVSILSLTNPAIPTGYVNDTAAQILTKLLTVDGSGSWLDADLLDGQSSAFYQSASNLNAGSVPDARVPSSNVTQHQAALALAASQTTSGTFADARVAQSNVTQHQAALSIATSQLTGTLADARLVSSNVTQFNSSIIGRNISAKSGTSKTLQSGGSASGGSDGDIIYIY